MSKLLYTSYIILIIIFLSITALLLYIGNKDDYIMWSLYLTGFIAFLLAIYFGAHDSTNSLCIISNIIGFVLVYSAFLKMTFNGNLNLDKKIVYVGHFTNIFSLFISLVFIYFMQYSTISQNVIENNHNNTENDDIKIIL